MSVLDYDDLLGEIEIRLDNQAKDFVTQNSKFNLISKRLSALESENRQVRVNGVVLENENKNLKERVEYLEGKEKENKSLRGRVEFLEIFEKKRWKLAKRLVKE